MLFTVLMSVYFKESPVFLKQALDSILSQTKPPSEIVLVKDGPLPECLEKVIEDYYVTWPGLFKPVVLKENVGLGKALNIGLNHCSCDIIARMDTDDIAVHNRFESQLDYLEKHPDVAVVGGFLEEFMLVPGDLKQFRTLPLNHESLRRFARKRNPLNHPSVMFRKSLIMDVGGYEPVFFFEDYYLWMKLIDQGFKLANIEKVLVHFRVGNDMIGRRHGLKYARHEAAFFNKIRKNKFMNNNDFMNAIATRIPLRLIPKRLLNSIYKYALRKI